MLVVKMSDPFHVTNVSPCKLVTKVPTNKVPTISNVFLNLTHFMNPKKRLLGLVNLLLSRLKTTLATHGAKTRRMQAIVGLV